MARRSTGRYRVYRLLESTKWQTRNTKPIRIACGERYWFRSSSPRQQNYAHAALSMSRKGKHKKTFELDAQQSYPYLQRHLFKKNAALQKSVIQSCGCSHYQYTILLTPSSGPLDAADAERRRLSATQDFRARTKGNDVSRIE